VKRHSRDPAGGEGRRIGPVRRLIRITGLVMIGVVAGVALFVGLVRAGVVRNPLWPTTHGDLALAQSDRPGLRVLFVGNSLTYTNSMPAMVEHLAEADGGALRIIPVWYTAGGWTLEEAADDAGLRRLMREAHWSYVVLQEQSQIGSLSRGSHAEMYAAAGALSAQASRNGSRTMLFAPWAWRSGDGWDVPGDSYTAMQQRIFTSYAGLSERLAAPVAPVGAAWEQAIQQHPGIQLWAGDGVHPSTAGSYLTACVFYVMLSGRDPVGDPFVAGLDPGLARELQTAAWDAASPFTPEP
jgi:hypothetical protein